MVKCGDNGRSRAAVVAVRAGALYVDVGKLERGAVRLHIAKGEGFTAALPTTRADRSISVVAMQGSTGS
jgi:hypothetical protein